MVIVAVVIVEVAAATAAVAAAQNLPPQCSTEIIARCGNSVACVQTEVRKVKAFCRQALFGAPASATGRRD